MPRLLVVHHTPSPALHSLLTAVLDGVADPALADVEVVTSTGSAVPAADVLEAEGVVVGGPVNLGYLAGALKHFFDQIYYPCLEDTVGRPFAAYLHGNDDLTGGLVALEKIRPGCGGVGSNRCSGSPALRRSTTWPQAASSSRHRTPRPDSW